MRKEDSRYSFPNILSILPIHVNFVFLCFLWLLKSVFNPKTIAG